MEIIVAGKCTNSFVPDEVRININFFVFLILILN